LVPGIGSGFMRKKTEYEALRDWKTSLKLSREFNEWRVK
jgi:hypothetical protein